MALANRIADIVAPERCFGAFDAAPLAQLQALAQLAGVRLSARVVHHAAHAIILEASCRGLVETIRLRLPADWFPPSVFVAYLNAKLADAGAPGRLVACNDSEQETVALCTPAQAAELRACIFARIDDLRWPAAARDPTELELRAAIRERADDDGPRLVLADWLIERDDPRGHFIMLQCHPDREMRDRARPLLEVHESTWTCHLPAWARDPVFERGFVVRVHDGRGKLVTCTADGDAPPMP